MTDQPILLVPALAALALATLALPACSGASAQLVEIAPSDGGAGTGASSGNGGGASSSPGAGNGNGNGHGNGSNGGAAPSQCPSGGTQQTNGSGDSQSNATDFDTVACGTLAPGKSYWWTFKLPSSTSTFGLAFTGGIQIELTLDGTTVNVVPGATLPFRTKAPYYVQITPSGSESVSYVLVVSEK